MGAQLKKQTQKANRSIMNNPPSINYRRKAVINWVSHT